MTPPRGVSTEPWERRQEAPRAGRELRRGCGWASGHKRVPACGDGAGSSQNRRLFLTTQPQPRSPLQAAGRPASRGTGLRVSSVPRRGGPPLAQSLGRMVAPRSPATTWDRPLASCKSIMSIISDNHRPTFHPGTCWSRSCGREDLGPPPAHGHAARPQGQTVRCDAGIGAQVLPSSLFFIRISSCPFYHCGSHACVIWRGQQGPGMSPLVLGPCPAFAPRATSVLSAAASRLWMR